MPFHFPVTRRVLVRLLVLVAVLSLPSMAFADCAHEIIDQAYKGKITKTYSQSCYNAAIKIEPVDGSSYSDIDSIIKEAKHVAALNAHDAAVASTPTTTSTAPRTQVANPPKTTATTTAVSTPKATVKPVKPVSTSLVGGGRVQPAPAKTHATTTPRSTTPKPEVTLLGAPSATPVLDHLAPAHAGDVPIAVIVLGVLAGLLVLAGVAGALVRRRTGRQSS